MLVKILTLAGLVAIMLAMGLKVKLDEVLVSARKPLPVALSLLANFVLVPLVTVGLLYLFQTNPLVSIGFLILAVCPAAPVGPPFAAVARGDVPFAIGQMVILAGLSAFVSPALLGALLPRIAPDTDLHVDYLAIVENLLVAQLLPLAAGLAIRRQRPALAERLAKTVGSLANLLLLGVVVLILANEYDTLALIRLRAWAGMLVLAAASLGIGWLLGGPGQARRRSLAVITGARNAAVALVIVSSNFAGTPAVTAVVAYGLVSIFASFLCASLLARVPPPVNLSGNPTQ